VESEKRESGKAGNEGSAAKATEPAPAPESDFEVVRAEFLLGRYSGAVMIDPAADWRITMGIGRDVLARGDREAILVTARRAGAMMELCEAMAHRMHRAGEFQPESVMEEAQALFRIERARRRDQRRRGLLKDPFSVNALDGTVREERYGEPSDAGEGWGGAKFGTRGGVA
jgi:hypothetical protein